METDLETKRALRKSLAELRTEIDRLEFHDADSKRKLEELIASVELQANSGDDRAQLDNLLLTVSKTLTHFEVEHPSLTATLGQMMTALSSIGI